MFGWVFSWEESLEEDLFLAEEAYRREMQEAIEFVAYIEQMQKDPGFIAMMDEVRAEEEARWEEEW